MDKIPAIGLIYVSAALLCSTRMSFAESNDMTFHQDLAWSPDGAKIAFSAMSVSRARWEKGSYDALKDCQYDIFVMNADGSDVKQLTTNTGYDLWLSWAPDGKRIVFGSNRDGNTDLYVMNADGTNQTRLTNLPGDESGPSWSPDGTKIAYMAKPKEGHWQLWMMNVDGANVKRLTAHDADDFNPVWSPDGKRIVFYSNWRGQGQDTVSTISKFDEASAPPFEIVTHSFPVNGVFPAWSHDGSEIIYGHEGLHVADANWRKTRKVIDDVNVEFGRFSPDGMKIAFVGGMFPDTDIYVMASDGSGKKTRLTR